MPSHQGGAAAAPHAGSSATATNTVPLFQSGRPEVLVAPVMVAPLLIASHDADVIATAVAPVVVAARTIAVAEESFVEEVNNRLLAQMLGLPLRQQYPPPMSSEQLIDHFRSASRSGTTTPTRSR